jgi:galactosylceramidase
LNGSATRVHFDVNGTQHACAADGVNCSTLTFDGHGGLSAGATSRLLREYPEQQRDEILDYLFLPNFGAGLAVLKVEIGGDTQSTDGTEASHMHARDELNCDAGYEGWLAAEARKRNPAVKVWSLSWGVPGWVGNVSGQPPTYFSDDNIAYQVAWLGCLRDHWGVESDYIGLWNERPQGSTDYAIKLRAALETAGFGHVGITVEATWQPLINSVLTNRAFNASVAAASKHYPCNSTSAAALRAGKKFWAGEDTQGYESLGNWSAAGCWGRKLNQHFVKMSSTSSVSWAVLWAAHTGVSGSFNGNAPVRCQQPWSGHYTVSGSLWMNAHWHQFAAVGWRFLRVGAGGGAGMLDGGGSYVTLVPPADDLPQAVHGGIASNTSSRYPAGTFTLIVETLTGSCGKQGSCNVDYPPGAAAPRVVRFQLAGQLAPAVPATAGAGSTHTNGSGAIAARGSTARGSAVGARDVRAVQLWCTNRTHAFFRHPAQPVTAEGVLELTVQPDTICTATSLPAGAGGNGSKGAHPPAPAAAPFPPRHSDNFTGYGWDAQAAGFSDVYGSFAVRRWGEGKNKTAALTQLATALPTGWAPVNYDPLTLIGDDAGWVNRTVAVNVTAMVNHSEAAPFAGASGHSVRVCAGCGDMSGRCPRDARGLCYGCAAGCCFNLSWTGEWDVKGAPPGTVSNGSIGGGFEDTWHDIAVVVSGADGSLAAWVDGVAVADVPGSCRPLPPTDRGGSMGMVGLGCGMYHKCAFSTFAVDTLA